MKTLIALFGVFSCAAGFLVWLYGQVAPVIEKAVNIMP